MGLIYPSGCGEASQKGRKRVSGANSGGALLISGSGDVGGIGTAVGARLAAAQAVLR